MPRFRRITNFQSKSKFAGSYLGFPRLTWQKTLLFIANISKTQYKFATTKNDWNCKRLDENRLAVQKTKLQ